MNKSLQSILIIFPEGNITNNPSLLSIVLLLAKYYKIYLFCQYEYQSKLVHDRIYHHILKDLSDENSIDINEKYIEDNISCNSCSLVIGVDQGIKLANIISKKNNIPLAYISYEIFFTHEWEPLLKQQEITACKNVDFAICQDSMRSFLLSKENNIPLEKIINIPVAESYNGPYKRSTYLYKKLNIPLDKKIVLYMGYFGQWSSIESLIYSIKHWPDQWVLVLHPRYGIDYTVLPFLDKIKDNDKIYLSSEPVNTTYDLEKIVCSTELGLVLYDIDLSSPYSGKNLLFVGLSSGKFAAFMKYKIPVIVNNNTNIADIVLKYNLGYVISNFDDIQSVLLNNNLSEIKRKCIPFFKKYLDFNLYQKSLLSIVKRTINKKKITNVVKKNNSIIDIKNNIDIRIDILYDKLRKTINGNIETINNNIKTINENINSFDKYKNSLLHNKIKRFIKRCFRKLKKIMSRDKG
jgi:hypothetical protein